MSKEELVAFVEKHKGELLLDLFDVVRLIDFAEDEEDYYYKVIAPHKGEFLLSCVGSLIPLKGSLLEEEYDALDRVFKLNTEGF